MLSRAFKRLGRDQQGVTGLETAIILIAFVVVASVFAYTVLSAGIFSAEKGKEAIHAGLESARGSMELVGTVKATSVASTLLDSGDTSFSWTVGNASVTIDTDTADRKEGTASIKITIVDSFTTGLVAYVDLGATVTLKNPQHYAVRLWIKSDKELAAGVLQLVIDDNAGCATTVAESIDIPALGTATWDQPVLDLASPTADALGTVACVGITAASDPGAIVVHVDLIQAPAEVTKVTFVLANALAGEPVDLTTTTDANGDGLLNETTATTDHKMTIIYSDKNQRTVDVAWTRKLLGKGDTDALLESGEQMRIIVNTHAANPMPVADTTFQLTLVRGNGAELVLKRTLPTQLDPEMDLN